MVLKCILISDITLIAYVIYFTSTGTVAISDFATTGFQRIVKRQMKVLNNDLHIKILWQRKVVCSGSIGLQSIYVFVILSYCPLNSGS